MSYMQNYVPSATAFSANQDDSAANSDAPTSFFYDAWAGSSSQAHAPTTPLHHHQQHTTTQTYATLAPYGSEEFYHTELVPDFAIITGPNLESHCNQPPTPLLDFLSLDMYKHLKPTCYHEPYVSNCKIESTQDWSALKAEIKAVFPNFDASSHLNLTKLMKQWEENFSTEPDFGVRHLHHTQLPLKPQSQLKHLLLRMSMGLARDVASKAFAFLDMADERGDMTKPFEESGRYLLETLAINVEDRVQARRKDDIMSPENRQSDKPDPKAEKTAYKDYLSIAAAAKARAGPNLAMDACLKYTGYTDKQMCREEAGVPNLPEQTFYSAFYLLDGLMTHELAGHAPYSLLTAGIFKAVTVDLLPVNQRQIDASRKYTGYTDKELDWNKEEIAAATARLMESDAWKEDDWEEEDGKEEDEVDEVDREVEELRGEPVPEDAPYPAEPTVVATPWQLEEMAAATAQLLESDAWKQDMDWDMDGEEEKEEEEDWEEDGEEELRGEPVPEDAPYPAEPTVVATPWELEEMAAATAQLLESDAWKQDVDWEMDGEEEKDGEENGEEQKEEEEEGELGWDDPMDVDDQDVVDWEGSEMDWEETEL
ncbi:hypothetical protein HDU78_004663 [Chytriomyces hyalinus]|nr:hypothetical protein HDU78_004663 [Chytriomyces hyalinus]